VSPQLPRAANIWYPVVTALGRISTPNACLALYNVDRWCNSPRPATDQIFRAAWCAVRLFLITSSRSGRFLSPEGSTVGWGDNICDLTRRQQRCFTSGLERAAFVFATVRCLTRPTWRSITFGKNSVFWLGGCPVCHDPTSSAAARPRWKYVDRVTSDWTYRVAGASGATDRRSPPASGWPTNKRPKLICAQRAPNQRQVFCVDRRL
jgi:hypothetical protein